jgi:hypothetical protein
MSREHILREALGKRLFRLKPEPLFEDEEGVEPSREMYVSADVSAAVTGPFPDSLEGRRRGEFWAWLEDWMYGTEIGVCEDPFDKPGETQLARVAPVEDEFWSIRVPAPLDTDGQPIGDGLRSLGGFHALDEFIALIWDYREVIDHDFDSFVDEVREVWRDIFDKELPHQGDNLHAYLTRFVAYKTSG